MPSPFHQVCVNCKYWSRLPDRKQEGYCSPKGYCNPNDCMTYSNDTCTAFYETPPTLAQRQEAKRHQLIAISSEIHQLSARLKNILNE